MPKLIAPAGDLEKLRYAVLYGADSVYLAGKSYGMRASAGNFTLSEIEEGIAFAHSHGVEAEIALNIVARDDDVSQMLSFAKDAAALGADRFIVADAGLVWALHEELPKVPITLSTQANATNSYSLAFWRRNGVSRVVLARELTLAELKGLCQNRPSGLELEVFIHGAMCISYSGRCLISQYLAGRDPNRGECAQPCRWEYTLTEKSRPGEKLTVVECGQSTFLYNSKDLCLARILPELIEMGIDAFKIEGRMKSAYYAATVTNAYKIAIERAASSDPYVYSDIAAELGKVSHRPYTEAFAGEEHESMQATDGAGYIRTHEFTAVCEGDAANGRAPFRLKNRFGPGSRFEALTPGSLGQEIAIQRIFSLSGEQVEEAIHPEEVYSVESEYSFKKYDLLRSKCE